MRLSTPLIRGRLFAAAAATLLCLGTQAPAALVTALNNGGFETFTPGTDNRFDQSVDGWLEEDPENQKLILNYNEPLITGNSSYPQNQTGDGALLLAVTTTDQLSYIFQSIGTVTQADIDSELTWGLEARAGARNYLAGGPAHSGIVSISFRTGTSTTAADIGVLLGLEGSRFISGTGTTATPLAPTSVASFRPTAANLGQEVFAIVAVEGVLYHTGSNQFVVDDVVLSIPEPASLLLLAGGLALVVSRRRGARV